MQCGEPLPLVHQVLDRGVEAHRGRSRRGVSEVAFHPHGEARLAVWVERYFGDTAPGAATVRFHAAVQHLMDEWERFAALHAGEPEIVDERGQLEGTEDARGSDAA